MASELTMKKKWDFYCIELPLKKESWNSINNTVCFCSFNDFKSFVLPVSKKLFVQNRSRSFDTLKCSLKHLKLVDLWTLIYKSKHYLVSTICEISSSVCPDSLSLLSRCACPQPENRRWFSKLFLFVLRHKARSRDCETDLTVLTTWTHSLSIWDKRLKKKP